MGENKENVLVPKSVFWSIVVLLGSGIISNFIYSWSRVTHIEKDLAVFKTKTEKELNIIELRMDRDEDLIRLNREAFSLIQADLTEIKSALKLKQDKRFLE